MKQSENPGIRCEFEGRRLRLAVDLKGQSATGAIKPETCNLARLLADI